MKVPHRRSADSSGRAGFTLVELLVSVAILAIILVLVAEMIGDTDKVWKRTSAKMDSLRDARLAFELMTDELRQATMNTYWDYFNATGQNVALWNNGTPSTPFLPAAYGRQSELHFICGNSGATAGAAVGNLGPTPGTALALPTNGIPYTQGVFFQFPGNYSSGTTYTSLSSLLTATGFFVEFCPDVLTGNTAYVANGPPTSVLSAYQPTYRFRLMQFLQPTENLTVYNYSLTNGTTPNAWFDSNINTTTLHAANVRIVANNVIALFILPQESDTDTTLAPTYNYDSRQGITSGAAIPAATWTPGTTPQPLQMNQMPPILRVAMVALDEPSAKVLQGSSTTAPTSITNALVASNPGTGVGVFTKAANLDSDLAYLQTELAAVVPHLNYHVFETTIAIRSAKFINP